MLVHPVKFFFGPRPDAELAQPRGAQPVDAAAHHGGVGKFFAQVVVAKVRVGVEMQQRQPRMVFARRLHQRVGDHARLDAAARVAAAGYRVAFHFDPIILYGENRGDWRADYRDVVRKLFDAVDPARVAWISLGTLRFPQRFLDAWAPRLRANPVFFDEFVPGEDGKLRYFWPLRRDAYRLVAGEIARRGGGRVPVYLCMEPASMWQAGLDRAPDEQTLARQLCSGCDESA